MAGMTAAEFEDVYGELTRSEYPDIHRERALSNVLAAREPPVIVPDGVLRVWLKKYKTPDGYIVKSIEDLQEKYGDLVKGLHTEHDTPYKLAKALRTTQEPPVRITTSMAGQWITKYGKPNMQRMFAKNGSLIPDLRTHPKGVRTYFGILY